MLLLQPKIKLQRPNRKQHVLRRQQFLLLWWLESVKAVAEKKRSITQPSDIIMQIEFNQQRVSM